MPVIIQTRELLNQRMLGQLARKKVDAGQYFGAETARAWVQPHRLSPLSDSISIPIAGEMAPPICVVDLGPGSGEPCVRAVSSFRDQVGQVIGVDTSAEMLRLAEGTIRAGVSANCELVVADFLQDTAELARFLAAVPLPRLVLCLGGTAGNFNQREVFAALGCLVSPEDRLLLGLGLCPNRDAQRHLDEMAAFYASAANCAFGLVWLRACGATPDHRYAESAVEEDAEEPGVWVLRGFYRFAERTVLSVADEAVLFQAGDRVQFVESRRFTRDGVRRHLARHGWQVVAAREQEAHGLFLCRKARS